MTNTLEENLDLRKALTEVDRLTSENVSLDYINSEQQIIIKNLKNENSELRDKYLERCKRIRKNEVIFKSYEKDMTALKKENKMLRSKLAKVRKSLGDELDKNDQ